MEDSLWSQLEISETDDKSTQQCCLLSIKNSCHNMLSCANPQCAQNDAQVCSYVMCGWKFTIRSELQEFELVLAFQINSLHLEVNGYANFVIKSVPMI